MFWRGTHRIFDPSQTLARVRPLASQMGITRVGNVTGLDRIGIPVAIAVRPNSRSVSVSQGKGLDPRQAMASALMEAAEGFHAEEIGECRRATYHELAKKETVIDPSALPPADRPFGPEARIFWSEGYDLLQREACWVPAELVHTDYTLRRDGYFLSGTNGLASGNHLIEAIGSAICELVERDGVALWNALGIRARAERGLDSESIDDADCRALLAKYDKAGIAVRLWNVTTDIGIAAFLCEIRDMSEGEPHWLRHFHGSGCHPDRAIALARALTEAAQARLTYITGIRDDLPLSEYDEPPNADIGDLLLDALRQEVELDRFDQVPSFAAGDMVEDVRRGLEGLQLAGISQAVVVDLSRREFAIPVVRVVLPGLEGDRRHPGYRPGRRARRAAAMFR